MKNTGLNYIIESTEGNTKLISEIIDIFVIQVNEIWIDMLRLYEDKNYIALGKLAHKAKTSVAILGMESQAQKLKELEIMCQNGKEHDLYPKYIAEFKSECSRKIEELLEYKNTVNTNI